jgi:hypothetical protein
MPDGDEPVHDLERVLQAPAVLPDPRGVDCREEAIEIEFPCLN